MVPAFSAAWIIKHFKVWTVTSRPETLRPFKLEEKLTWWASYFSVPLAAEGGVHAAPLHTHTPPPCSSDALCPVPVTPALTTKPSTRPQPPSSVSDDGGSVFWNVRPPNLAREGAGSFSFSLISCSSRRWPPSSWPFSSNSSRCSSCNSSTSCLYSAKAFLPFSQGSLPFPSSRSLKVSVRDAAGAAPPRRRGRGGGLSGGIPQPVSKDVVHPEQAHTNFRGKAGWGPEEGAS